MGYKWVGKENFLEEAVLKDDEICQWKRGENMSRDVGLGSHVCLCVVLRLNWAVE